MSTLFHSLGEQGPMTAGQTLNDTAHIIARCVAYGFAVKQGLITQYMAANTGMFAESRAYLTQTQKTAPTV